MKKSFFLPAIFALSLVACASNPAAQTAFTLVNISATPLSEFTPTPVASSTPTETLTPTLHPTDTLTPTPDIATQAAVTPEKFWNFDYDTGFIPVTHDQALELSKDIVSGVDAKLSSDDSVDPAVVYGADGYQVWISGTIGVNLFPRFAIVESGEHGTEHNVLWEIVVQDQVSGHNKREPIKMSFDPEYTIGATEMRVVTLNLRSIAELTHVEIHLVSQFEGILYQDMNPVLKDVTGGTNPVRQRLQQLIIDDETGTVPVWNRDVMP